MARALPTASQHDIIVSRATPPGDGAIAIVRLSGRGSTEIAAKVFSAKSSQAAGNFEAGKLVLGTLHETQDMNAIIDEAFLVAWKAPRSYTGEDMAEFQLHGSPVIVDRVINSCVAAGARMAQPGEFTRRAYLNGKLDLVQAEAVCDLIRAQTDSAQRAALTQLSGGLSRVIASLRERLVPVIAELEAHVDFPEEGLEFSTRTRLGNIVNDCIREMQNILETASRGQHLREGARIVLAGAPNAGKSSLFNLLVRRERALVTPHPGTTRDTIEAQVDLGGYPITLVDTAGLRDRPEEIEALGIARTREEIGSADLVLYLVDQYAPKAGEDEYRLLRSTPHFLVINKIDLPADAEGIADVHMEAKLDTIRISTTTRAGVERLENALVEWLGGTAGEERGGLISNRRHVAEFNRALEALHTSAEGLASELSPEFVVVDLTEAVAALDSITGRQALDEDVLDAIFSTFCLGK